MGAPERYGSQSAWRNRALASCLILFWEEEMGYASHPEAVGLSSERVERLYAFLGRAVAQGELPGAAILIRRNGVALEPRGFGRRLLVEESDQVRPDTTFLVASLTKPVTVAGAMLLVERGLVSLDDRISSYLPAFGANGKEDVRVVHLMTHTSGLPDMLPENQSLRERHAPLSEFVNRTCALSLDFESGTHIQYQSMGIAVLAALVEKVTGTPLPQFLREQIFVPLRMYDTSLGLPGVPIDRIAEVDVGPEMVGTDWGWNTPYWRGLGAPWGGMLSTVEDMSRFCQGFLSVGSLDGAQVFSRAVVEAMTRDQITGMPLISAEARAGRLWGLGWRLFPTRNWSYFGDLLTPGSFGHGGATGTVMWVDPSREMVCVLHTTKPSVASGRLLSRCSNLVAACAV